MTAAYYAPTSTHLPRAEWEDTADEWEAPTLRWDSFCPSEYTYFNDNTDHSGWSYTQPAMNPLDEPTSSNPHLEGLAESVGLDSTATLEDLVIALVVRSALIGWTPRDLHHHLGSIGKTLTRGLDYFCFRALPDVDLTTVDQHLIDVWRMHTPPVARPKFPAFDTGELRNGWGWGHRHVLFKMIDALLDLPGINTADLAMTWEPTAGHGSTEDTATTSAERIRAKITALLAKAESTEFESEAIALTEKAAALQAQYNIEWVPPQADASVVTTRVYIDAPYVTHKATLLSVVASNSRCRSVLLTTSGIAVVIGHREDVVHTIDLFTSLARQCDHLMRTVPAAADAREQGTTARFRNSFQLAFSARVHDILHTAMETAADTASSQTTVALRSANALVEEAFQELYPKTGTFRLSAHDSAGFQAGWDGAGASHFGGDSSGVSGTRMLTA